MRGKYAYKNPNIESEFHQISATVDAELVTNVLKSITQRNWKKEMEFEVYKMEKLCLKGKVCRGGFLWEAFFGHT